MTYCPRCGVENNQESVGCSACNLPLAEISRLVANGGRSRYWQRVVITLLIFVSVPLIVMKIGGRLNQGFYDLLAGFLLVLLLPGLPWIVATVLNHATGPRR